MKRSLLALALIMAAIAAVAQTPPAKISTEAEAKAALEADGYKSVSWLRLNADGKWTGSAMRGNQQTAVSVDADGKVSSQ
jgi:hypothetical protein